VAELADPSNVRSFLEFNDFMNNTYFVSRRLLVNTALGATPLNSPLESPDIIQTFVPLGSCAVNNPSIGLYNKTMDNNNARNHHHQVRPPFRITSLPFNTTCLHTLPSHKSTSTMTAPPPTTTTLGLSKHDSCKLFKNLATGIRNFHSSSGISGSISELPELNLTNSTKSISQSCNEETENFQYNSLTASNNSVLSEQNRSNCNLSTAHQIIPKIRTKSDSSRDSKENLGGKSFIGFSLSSVGRSFIDERHTEMVGLSPFSESINTPETPPPNISPSSSNRFSEAFSNDFTKEHVDPSATISPIYEKFLEAPENNFGGSWDLLEIDLDFHKVNLDTCFAVDVKEECFFLGDEDDPFGMLPNEPTAPNLFDL
jgi:hypothetical protein